MAAVWQVAGDDTTVLQAVLACDTERSQLLKEEQTLLRQLNKEAPEGAQPSQAATANGPAATADAKPGLSNGNAATAAEGRDSSGASGGKEVAGKLTDASETKMAAQLAQVCGLGSQCEIPARHAQQTYKLPLQTTITSTSTKLTNYYYRCTNSLGLALCNVAYHLR